ncbi:hypothetical protein SAMN05518672_104435 [Chitinophaga sp. CF118]|uniref:hypothetical protein n=1 Tax=Chitinophaga sp. CF118 TaxID=1884367 RepID=UPI0008E15D67|nr:hypothetical protein [Chitinophaga sp. CF118]SFE08946.1 hypothetical protein SAMN05518672_104435 [Chitinophaga sp. CF118]
MTELSKEEENILKRINEKSKSDYKAFEKFRTEEYPKKSLEERIDYWTDLIYKNMKWQGEVTGDEYDGMFTKEWFDDNVRFDPEFNKIFSVVAENLKLDMKKLETLK